MALSIFKYPDTAKPAKQRALHRTKAAIINRGGKISCTQHHKWLLFRLSHAL